MWLEVIQVEFAYNYFVKRGIELSSFQVNYIYNPWAPVNLAPVPDLVCKSNRGEDFIVQLQNSHTVTQEPLKKTTEGYKIEANKSRQALEFHIGDLVWAMLTMHMLSICMYNKLSASKIGPLEII